MFPFSVWKLEYGQGTQTGLQKENDTEVWLGFLRSFLEWQFLGFFFTNCSFIKPQQKYYCDKVQGIEKQ